jgi:hypothetical protein
LFGYRGRPGLAVFFGILPDLFSFGLFGIFRLFEGNFQIGPPPLNIIPAWVTFNYNLSHSFIPALLFISLLATKRKDIAFAMLGWPLHIIMDLPFHSNEYFPTQFLWPLTDFTINGIPWSHPLIWFPNLAGIIILYFYRFRKRS